MNFTGVRFDGYVNFFDGYAAKCWFQSRISDSSYFLNWASAFLAIAAMLYLKLALEESIWELWAATGCCSFSPGFNGS